MNWNNVRRQLQNDGLSHEEIEARLDELLDQDRAEPEPNQGEKNAGLPCRDSGQSLQ